MLGKIGFFSSMTLGIVVVALTVGAALAAGASWVGWWGAPSLPTDAEATSLAGRLVPGGRPTRIERREVVFDYAGTTPAQPWRRMLLGDDDYDAGLVEVTTPVPDSSATVRDALVRLRADGWQLRRQGAGELTAELGGDFIELHTSDPSGRVTASPTAVTLAVRRAEPQLVPYASIGGWAVGLLIGLGLVVRGVRRRARAGFAVLTGLGVLALLPGTLISSGFVLTYLTSGGPAFPDAPWGGYMLRLVRPASLVGGVLLLLAALVALVSGRRGDGGAPSEPGTETEQGPAADVVPDRVPDPDTVAIPVRASPPPSEDTVLIPVVPAVTSPAVTSPAVASPAPAAAPEAAPGDPFVKHEDPIWRDRADFVINAALPGRFEQIWARQVADDQFEVCCIPFQLYGVALGDVVKTAPAGGLQYVVERVLTPSGRHVFRVFFTDPFQPQAEITHELAELGALLEFPDPHVLAVDARDDEHAGRIGAYLRAGQAEGNLGFELGRHASDQPDPLGLSTS